MGPCDIIVPEPMALDTPPNNPSHPPPPPSPILHQFFSTGKTEYDAQCYCW